MFNNQGLASEEQSDEDRGRALIKSFLFGPYPGAPHSFNPPLGLSYGSLLPTPLFALGKIAEAKIEENRSPSPQTPVLPSCSSYAPQEIKPGVAAVVRPLSAEDLEEKRSIAAAQKSKKIKKKRMAIQMIRFQLLLVWQKQ